MSANIADPTVMDYFELGFALAEHLDIEDRDDHSDVMRKKLDLLRQVAEGETTLAATPEEASANLDGLQTAAQLREPLRKWRKTERIAASRILAFILGSRPALEPDAGA